MCPCYLLVPVLVDVILCSGDWVGFKGMRRFAMIFFFFFLTAVLLIAIEIFHFFTILCLPFYEMLLGLYSNHS